MSSIGRGEFGTKDTWWAGQKLISSKWWFWWMNFVNQLWMWLSTASLLAHCLIRLLNCQLHFVPKLLNKMLLTFSPLVTIAQFKHTHSIPLYHISYTKAETNLITPSLSRCRRRRRRRGICYWRDRGSDQWMQKRERTNQRMHIKQPRSVLLDV